MLEYITNQQAGSSGRRKAFSLSPSRLINPQADEERALLTYDKDTLYVIGDAQASLNNPITQQYSAFFIGLVVDSTNHKIVDAGCSSTIPLTSDFVRSIFVGHSILHLEPVADEIKHRYHGSSQKALIVAFKDAQKKYQSALQLRESSL